MGEPKSDLRVRRLVGQDLSIESLGLHVVPLSGSGFGHAVDMLASPRQVAGVEIVVNQSIEVLLLLLHIVGHEIDHVANPVELTQSEVLLDKKP